MRRYVIMFFLLLAVCGCSKRTPSQWIPGRWSFAADVGEYHGLYVFDFRKDGRLILEDYAEGFKPGDPPSAITEVGRYSFLANNQISIQDTNKQERAVYKMDEPNKCLVYMRGVEKGDIHLVRPFQHNLLYNSK
jgi:hypothetical protein